MAVLVGTVALRLGCAWSCQPSPVTAKAEHCHNAPATAADLSVPPGCDSVRADGAVLAATIRPDVAVVAPDQPVTVFASVSAGPFDSRGAALLTHASPPDAFAIPLRQ